MMTVPSTRPAAPRHAIVVLVAVLLGAAPAIAQHGAAGGEWRSYAGDAGGSKYSPLEQIHAGNVQDLHVAWRWRSVDHELADADPDLQFSPMLLTTPLMVGGRLLMATNLGQAAAIDPATGETTWVYRALEDGAGRPRGGPTRGVGYWHDPERDDERIFVVSGEQLVALDARTGDPLREFGAGGRVDLSDGVPHLEEYRWTASPLLCRDTIIVGIFTIDQFDRREQAPGYIRGYDAVTGQLRWRFNTIPQPGEFGHETWEDGSWEHTGASNVWTTASADEELGYAYLPTATPTHNWYGGHRPGDNLFAETLLCLECETGRRVWHYQLIHHGIWDYDTASTPILADITVDGRPIKAVVQVTKQAFAYVFDPVTGEPVWPIEERPVPQSDVPGERTSPTQPFPTRPAPFDRQGITVDDLIDFTPELRAEALEIFNRYRGGPIFTPPSLRDESPGGTLGTLQLPGWVGGANWNGAAYDPETQMLYVPSITAPIQIWLREAPDESPFRYLQGPVSVWIDGPRGLPLVKPPWGRITAIDLNTGEHVWMVPNGPGPRDHIALQDLALPWLGAPGRAAPLLTKSLLFLGDGSRSMQVVPPLGGGRMFRAYDKATGRVLWQTELAAGVSGAPMTYMHDGTQYVVVAVSGRDHDGELVAFAVQLRWRMSGTRASRAGTEATHGRRSNMGDGTWQARAAGVAAAAVAAGCLVMSGGDDRAHAQGERDVLAVAQDYFRALYAPDHDRVREVASPAMTFADPTAEGQPVAITNAASRDEFLSYLQANNVGSDAEAVVDRAFQTGRYATLYVTYRGTVDGEQLGRPGARVAFETSGVTILTVENGLVTHHQDYVDYETLDRQFGGELLPPAER